MLLSQCLESLALFSSKANVIESLEIIVPAQTDILFSMYMMCRRCLESLALFSSKTNGLEGLEIILSVAFRERNLSQSLLI